MLVTYRNCPNNAPLVLWYGNPSLPRSHPLSKWWPLFPRRREDRWESFEEPKSEADSREDDDEGLFESLRKLRRKIADEKHVPPFVVFHDAVLRNMARQRPKTPEAFLRIHGVGPQKCSQYGAAFIDEIRKYCEAKPLETDITQFPRDPSLPRPKVRERRATPTRSKLQAFALFERGVLLDDVARTVGRAQSTTLQYLVEYIDAKRINYPAPWVSERTYRRVADASRGMNLHKVKPIFEALGGNVPYDQVRVCVACLRQHRRVDHE
jgi:ATP-dependent DNA helicase RecQ